MAWCLTKQAEQNLIEALKKDGDPQKMVDRGTEGRLAWFEKYAGKENAQPLNYLFETKMLLKSQQRGFESFVKNLGGSKQIKTDFLTKVGRLQSALSKKEVGQYLEGFVSQRLGTTVTEEEFKVLDTLSTKLSELRTNFDEKTLSWKSPESAKKFGATQVAFNNYVESLKSPELSIRDMLKDRGYQFKEELAQGKVKAVGKLLLDTARQISDNAISLKATWDDSFIGRQGIFTLLTGHPKLWGKVAISSIRDFATTLRGGRADDALMATVYSDPFFLNGEYEKAKIIDRTEEQFPTSIPERIPVLGRFFKASEVAFKGSGIRTRTELYKILRNVKVSREIEMTPEEIKGMGKVVNSIVARGDLGRAGSNSFLRLLMWAPKMLKADFDILTAHSFDNITKADRSIATGNLLKIVVATALIEAIATLNDEESTEGNPLSSDFLAIKWGDTRFKFLRGIPSMITLLSRMVIGKYKSATTGEIKEYGTDFAQRSRFDAVVDFFLGKAPPATGAVATLLKGRDYEGKAPTFTSILIQIGVPISIENFVDWAKNPSIDRAVGVIADFFGFSSNTFRDSNIKSEIIPTEKVIKNEDFATMVAVYAKALGTDPETAFNRIFTGQKIMQVSDGGIIVVDRQDVEDSEAFKKEWVREHGGSIKDMKEVRLDHTIPNKLGGSETPENWKVVTKSVWESYTRVENALIKAVKEKKVSLKEAQKLIVEFKAIEDNKKREERGKEIINSFK